MISPPVTLQRRRITTSALIWVPSLVQMTNLTTTHPYRLYNSRVQALRVPVFLGDPPSLHYHDHTATLPCYNYRSCRCNKDPVQVCAHHTTVQASHTKPLTLPGQTLAVRQQLTSCSFTQMYDTVAIQVLHD